MKRPVRCPFGTIYDADAHVECPCPNCTAERSSGQSIAPVTSLPGGSGRLHRSPTLKVLTGAVAALVVVAVGYYGVKLWIKSRVEHDIDSAFLNMRAVFGSAEHGQTEFDPWSGTLKISDVLLRSNTDPSTTIKVGQLVASGIGLPIRQIGAHRIDIADWEFAGALSTTSNITQKAPTISIENFSVLRSSFNKPDASSAADKARLVIEYLAAISATSLSIPTVSAIVTPIAPGGGIGSTEHIVSNVQLRGIEEGRIASMSIDRVETRGAANPRGGANWKGEIAKISASDFDARTLAAVLGEASPNEDTYQRVYREVLVGPFTGTSGNGEGLRIDGVALNDLSVKPSQFAWSKIMALVAANPNNSRSASSKETSAVLGTLAQLCEGLRVMQFELRGVKVDAPGQVDMKLVALRLSGLESGRIAELVVEELDGTSAQRETISVGRFAVKGLGLASLLRTSAQLSTLRPPPSPQQLTELLAAVEGIEINRLIGPETKSGQPVRFETMEASWGHFVAAVPSTARLAAKMIIPTSLVDQGPFGDFAKAGFRNLTYTIDLGGAWDESTQTFAVTPAKIEMENLFSASATLALSKVSRDVFVVDPAKFKSAAETLEAGVVEFSLRDTGGLNFWITQFAKNQGLSPTSARQVLIVKMTKELESQSQSNPDIQLLTEAITRFMEKPGQTLAIKLTPNGRVNVVQALAAAPLAALSRFKLDAKIAQ